MAYYITGIPSSGKSSVRRSMRGLILIPEWRTQPPQLMNEPYDTLSPQQTKDVDEWTVDQFKRKNERLEQEGEGIFIIDRAPLDPLSFTKDKDLKEKTERYWDAIAPSLGKPLEPGSIILLKGDSEEIHFRLARKTGSSKYTTKYLAEMQDRLLKIYKDKNVRIIDTRRMTLDQVVKEVSEVVHREEYKVVALSRPRQEELACK